MPDPERPDSEAPESERPDSERPDSEQLGDVLGDLYEQGLSQAPEDVALRHPDLARHLDALDDLRRAHPPDGPPRVTPRVLGDFRVLKEIGRGGMGIVYEAEQRSLRRRVALKVLHPGVALDERAVRRFRAEARTASRIHHTNLVPVYAMGEEGGTWWYAMEFVEGRTLDLVIEDLRRLGHGGDRGAGGATTSEIGSAADGRGFYARVARLFAGVAEALAAAHAVGVVHRDVKPSNLILGPDGHLKLTDFGLAFTLTGRSFATATGGIVGTPLYMSPEQAAGAGVDGRTDVFSLGATLYEVLALRAPFADGGRDLAQRLRTREPTPPRRLDARVPRDLETIVLKALETDPSRRYHTCQALCQDLRAFADGLAVKARRVGPLGRLSRRIRRHKAVSGLVAGVLLLGATGAVLGLRAHREESARLRLEYDRLVASADAALVAGHGDRGSPCAEMDDPRTDASAERYARALKVDPRRPEAYLGRALAGGPKDARLADLEAARARGLSERTYHLARASLFFEAGSREDAETERRLAEQAPEASTPLDALLQGSHLAARRRHAEALLYLSEAVDRGPAGSSVWTRALLERTRVHEELGERLSAFGDLSAAVATGGLARPDVRVHLASLWRRIGQPERGEDLLEETLRSLSEGDDPSEWIDACRASLREARWADRVTEEALRRHPKNVCIGLFRSESLAKANRNAEGLALAERLAAEHPDDARVRAARAQHLATLGRPEEALQVLGPEAPDEGPAQALARSEALLRTGRPEEALAVLDRLIARDPYHPTYPARRAGVLRELGRSEEAVAALRTAIVLQPGWGGYHALLGLLEWDCGRRAEAIAALREAVRLDPDAGYAWTWLALRLREMKDESGALAAFREVVRIDPKDHKAWATIGNLLMESDLDGAAEAFRAAIRAKPDDASAYYNLGNVLKRQGKLAPAVEQYEHAIRLNPSHVTALSNMGQTLEAMDDPARAETAYREAIRRDPRFAHARKLLGYLLAKREDHAEAEEMLTESVRLDAADPEARLGLSVLLRTLKRLEEAEIHAREAVLLRPDPAAYVELGSVLDEQGDRDGALKAYGKALEIDPDFAGAHHERGVLWRDAGDYEQALAHFRKAAALNPTSAPFRVELGRALVHEDETEEAVRQFTEAIRLRPDYPEAHLYLGLTHYQREEWESARDALERAVALRSSYGLAHRWLGITLEEIAVHRRPPDAEALRARAVESLWRAVDRDPFDSEAPRWIGNILSDQGRYEGALEAYTELQKRSPGGLALGRVADCLRHLGRFDEALETYEQAAAAQPPYVWADPTATDLLVSLRRYDAAIQASDRALARGTKYLMVGLAKARALHAMGRSEDARAFAKEASEGSAPADDPVSFAHLKVLAGDPQSAEEALAIPFDLSPSGMRARARVHAALGDLEAALLWLAKAAEAGYREPPGLAHPEFEPYAADPRVAEALARLVRR